MKTDGDVDTKKTDIKLIEGNLNQYDVRAADQAEEDKDFIKLSSMVKFMCDELGMHRNSDHLRLTDLLDVILISA